MGLDIECWGSSLFCDSGYLYGTKEISNWKMWFVKRVEKIYIPFILFVFVMLTLYACFSDISIKFSFVIKYLLNIQGIIGGVNGLGHLWFITAIFLCYLVVPILQRLKKWSDWILLFLLFVGILQYVFIHFYLIYFSWFFLFSSGYFYAAASDQGKRWFRIGMLIGLIMVCMIIGWKDIIDYDSWLNGLFHALLGFVIVAYGGLSLVWLKMENGKLVKWFDNLSFDIYMTHHVFCLGSFSLIKFTPYSILNIALILVASLGTAMLLKYVTTTCFRIDIQKLKGYWTLKK